ncbi:MULTISPECIES: hypothetical protein [unclassified Leptolyngbya]|uniref:tetratricopeptide repeat protein n=1 Tax=unclassified Leptolyngbya TaxID=2650499 RepID=UPI001685C403|nr:MULTISPECIES: hypothetical protein [unclassified Leptolyngbya]MBD1913954.1 hypothetical protein [Leptolyngbya sp. FACHB-8]MBD2155921.1 hypothetical protein [Leptolyngbya sp. FACHB-16]
MVSVQIQPRWLSGVMALCLMGPLASAWVPVQAQGPIQAQPVVCATERQQVIQGALLDIQNEFERELRKQNYPQAGQTLGDFFEATRQLDEQTRAGYLTLFLLEESNQQYAQWRQLVDYSVKTKDTTAIAPALTAAVEATQTLSSGHSFSKTRLFTVLAGIYTELGYPESALTLLNQALQASQTIRGAEFQTNALAPLAEAYLKIQEPVRAMTVLDQTRAIADQVNDPAYPSRRGRALGQVAVVYAKADQVGTALDLAEQIKNDPENQGYVLQAVAEAYLRAGDRTTAMNLTGTIASPAVRAATLLKIAEYEASQGNSEQAAALYAQVGEMSPEEIGILNPFIEGYAQLQPETALRVARALSRPEQRFSALSTVSLAYRQAGNAERADAVVEEMVAAAQQLPEDWQGFNISREVERAIAIQAYDQAIRLALVPDPALPYYSRGQVLADIAYRAAEAGNDASVSQALAAINPAEVEIRTLALESVAQVYVRANQVDRALSLAEQIEAAYTAYRIRVVAAIAGEVYRIGGIDPATPLFDQALQQTRALSRPEDKVIALGAIALAYSRTGQISQAQELIDQMKPIVPSFTEPYLATAALKPLVEKFSATDQHVIALQLAQLIPETSPRSYTLEAAIEQAIDAEQYGLIPPMLDGLELPETRARWLLVLSDRYRQTDQAVEALGALTQALEVTRTVADPETRVLVFGTEGATVVEDDFDRASLLEKIALRYVLMGRRPQALQVTALIQDQANRDRVNQRLRCW